MELYCSDFYRCGDDCWILISVISGSYMVELIMTHFDFLDRVTVCLIQCVLNITDSGADISFVIIMSLNFWSVFWIILYCHWHEYPYWEACAHLDSQEIFCFYATKKVIAMFTRAIHLILLWDMWIQFTPFHPFLVYSHFSIILSSNPTFLKWPFLFMFSDDNIMCIYHNFIHNKCAIHLILLILSC